MAVADLDDYEAKLASPFRTLQMMKASIASPVNGRHYSLWNVAPYGGSAPGAAAAPTKDTPIGSLDYENRAGNPSADAFLAAAELRFADGGECYFVLCDRLSHQSGLDGTVTTAGVTTNLPTAALTRYTNGVGVMAGIEIYTILGTTASTITCSYTNDAGTAGRTSQPIVIGATNNREANRLMPLNLQAGDSGVRSIQNSTLAGTTGTAGNFGYTLFRPLAMIPAMRQMKTDWNALLGGGGQLAEIVDDAHLFWLALQVGGSAISTSGVVKLIEA